MRRRTGFGALGEGAYGKVYVDGTDLVKAIPCGGKADQLMARWEFDRHAQPVAERCINVVMPGADPSDARPEGTVAARSMERARASARRISRRVPGGSSVEASRGVCARGAPRRPVARPPGHASARANADIKPANVLLKVFPGQHGGPAASAVKLLTSGWPS